MVHLRGLHRGAKVTVRLYYSMLIRGIAENARYQAWQGQPVVIEICAGGTTITGSLMRADDFFGASPSATRRYCLYALDWTSPAEG
jgi:hypothetical protein